MAEIEINKTGSLDRGHHIFIKACVKVVSRNRVLIFVMINSKDTKTYLNS